MKRLDLSYSVSAVKRFYFIIQDVCNEEFIFIIQSVCYEMP
jgi:hypothetical protein